MMQRLMVTILAVLQIGLGVYELAGHYDDIGRQVALTLTNAFTTGMYFLVAHWLRRKYGTVLHWVVLLILSAAVWLDALGNFQHYYVTIWWWDRLTHAVGGLAVTAGLYITIIGLWRAKRLGVSWRVANVYAFALAQTLGAMYEVSEWLGDIWFGTHRVGERFDSPRDIFFNIVGGLVVVALGWWWRIRQTPVRGQAPEP
jgi:uncharacterized membrane protein YjdF